MQKHAFLIIAHHEFEILEALIYKLDHVKNDFYIHIDKKAGDIKCLVEKIKPKYSQIHFIERISVTWGGYSQIKCEYLLLKNSIINNYDFYHLLSGVDLPIKNVNDILKYFEDNPNKNFIGFDESANESLDFLERIRYYHFLQEIVGRKNTGFLFSLQNKLILIQKKLGVSRLKKNLRYYKGGNWFSINHLLAARVVNDYKIIRKMYRYTCCSDEIFLQTYVKNCELRESVFDNSLRLTDWQRGTPYTFKSDDFPMIKESEQLFARKFSTSIDKNIIDIILKEL